MRDSVLGGMRPLSVLLIFLSFGGILHAHDACEEEPCPSCLAEDQALISDAPDTGADRLVAATATGGEPAAPTTGPADAGSARAPPPL